MNKSKNQSIAHKVRQRIEKSGGDTLWTFRELSDLPPIPVAAALSRLSKSGVLVRLRRGIYYFPKKTTFGNSRPDPEKVTEAILRLNRTKAVKSGASEFTRFGLTTQVSGALTMASDRPTVKKDVLGIPLRMRYRRLSEQKTITSDERTFLDALRGIQHIPDATPSDVLKRLTTMIKEKRVNFSRLARFALFEPPRARALLGALAENLPNRSRKKVGIDAHSLEQLRKSLHGLSKYRIRGIKSILPTAHRWGIQ